MSESDFSYFSNQVIASDIHYRPISTPDIIREEPERYHEGLSRSSVQQFNYLAQAYNNTPQKRTQLYPYRRALQKQTKMPAVNPKLVIKYGQWLNSPRDVGYKLDMESKRDILAESYRSKHKENFNKYSRGMIVKTPRKQKKSQPEEKPKQQENED
ncbi:uncharacterized protein LOC134839285 [Symsagittifera roscoffensis]|uniref:uncharacterized protein LOC134839285 n=1 Tax=Symsagittifera roscoffensis TaxID=84072 RepID=UPI00307B2B77